MKKEDFLDYLKTCDSSPETVRAYKRDLVVFERFLAERRLRLSQVTPKVMLDFVRVLSAGGKLAPATIGRRLAAVSSYFDYGAAETDGRLKNPLRGRRIWRGRRERKPQPLEEYELDRLLTGIDVPRDGAIFDLFIASGLRISELHQLNRDSIRVITREVHPGGPLTTLGQGEVVGKGQKRRSFLIDEATCRTLAGVLTERGRDGIEALFISSRGSRLSVRAIRERFHYWCKRLGIPRRRVHQLRHSFATRMANAGMDSLVLRDLLGHSSLATTRGYFRMETKTMAQQYFAAMELRSAPRNQSAPISEPTEVGGAQNQTARGENRQDRS
jgi:site-specific recombinase XerC